MGLLFNTPVLAKGLAINSEQWFASTVLLPETPGKTLFLPPEKPAKKCGSINPSAIKRSALTAIEFISQSLPDGNLPILTSFSFSSQS